MNPNWKRKDIAKEKMKRRVMQRMKTIGVTIVKSTLNLSLQLLIPIIKNLATRR